LSQSKRSFHEERRRLAAKQHAVQHDGVHVAVGLEAGDYDYMLHEHEVGLLAGFRAKRPSCPRCPQKT